MQDLSDDQSDDDSDVGALQPWGRCPFIILDLDYARRTGHLIREVKTARSQKVKQLLDGGCAQMTSLFFFLRYYQPVPYKGLKFLLDHDYCSFNKNGIHVEDNGSRGGPNYRYIYI